jgi:tetratricopeptide (TPR) repeat protein
VTSLVLLAVIGYLGGQSWRRGQEYFWLERAARARVVQKSAFSPAEVALLERAYAAEPMNFETACTLGEAFRIQSFVGAENCGELATNALTWLERAMRLNPHDATAPLRSGMCLDWVDRHAEAGPYFDRAAALDPNGYYTVAYVGWHYVQLGNYAAARPWFELSRRLEWKDNPMAETYLQLSQTRLLEAATNTSPLRIQYPLR